MEKKYTTEQLIGQYIKLRDRKDEIAAENKKNLEPITNAMSAIESYLLNEMNEAGETNRSTKAGTSFIQVKEFLSVEDADSYFDFIFSNSAREFLKKDVVKTTAQQYIEKNGVPPPGVKLVTKREVQIRRPR